jgi:DNA polymerase-3 subunit alpha
MAAGADAKTYPAAAGRCAANGLIALSGAHFGDIGMAIENGNLALAEPMRVGRHFPGHFYIEIQRAGQANQECRCATGGAGVQAGLAGGGHPSGAVPVAGRIHCARSRVCIAEGEMLANAKRVRKFNEQMRFLSQAEMGAVRRPASRACRIRWKSPSAAT